MTSQRAALEHNGRIFYQALLLVFVSVAACLAAGAVAERGQVVSKDQLVAPLAPEQDHPLPRVVIKVDEDDLSSASGAKDVLVVHYRATPTSTYSFNDDVVVIAFRDGENYRIAEVLQSDAGMVNGELDSQNEYDEEFVSINNMRFLYVRNRVSGTGGIVEHNVYTVSGAASLEIIPFADLRKPKLLNPREEVRNGHYKLSGEDFDFEAGIYQPQDPECCPANGAYHAQLKLQGGFQQKTAGPGSVNDFKFVVVKDWRTKAEASAQDFR